jgi:hypothetical protein
MIKLKDILNEATSPVKIGSALPGVGGRKKEIELVVDRFMSGKWTVVSFNMVRKYVSGVGVSPDRLINYDDIFKLSSSEKNTIKKIIKNPEDIAYMDDENVKPIDVLRAIK